MNVIDDIIQYIMSNEFSSLSKEERIKVEFDAISLFDDSSKSTEKELLNMICEIKRNKQRGAYAPHKPVLLLSIIELIEEGVLTTNKIELNEVLKRKYNSVWSKNVPQRCKFKCNIKAPFIYLNHESFWTLSENKKEAVIDEYMFYSFTNERIRKKIKDILLYMAQNKSVPQDTEGLGMVAERLIMMIPAASPLIALYA